MIAAITPLAAENVSVSFDGLKALTNVSLRVERARVTGLIGPNGAGKTTLVNVLTGFLTPTAGRISISGAPLNVSTPHMVRRVGIARTFQSGRLFGDLTVLENLEVTGVGLGLSRSEASKKAMALLEWMGIDHLVDDYAGSLPYTDERRVAIGRALMEKPHFLLLDEPAAGMSAEEADDLASLIRRIVSDFECGVLLIEHNVGLVLAICDDIYVLDSGEIIEHGTPDAIKNSEKVRHAYMGTAADAEGEIL